MLFCSTCLCLQTRLCFSYSFEVIANLRRCNSRLFQFPLTGVNAQLAGLKDFRWFRFDNWRWRQWRWRRNYTFERVLWVGQGRDGNPNILKRKTSNSVLLVVRSLMTNAPLSRLPPM